MDQVQGTFAEYVSVPACQLLPLSEGLPGKEAILVEPLAVVIHFFRISMEGSPETMVIWGAGTIGSLALVLATGIVIDDAVVVELKAVYEINNFLVAQMLSYLKVSGHKLGLIINFGRSRVQIKRVAL